MHLGSWRATELASVPEARVGAAVAAALQVATPLLGASGAAGRVAAAAATDQQAWDDEFGVAQGRQRGSGSSATCSATGRCR